MSRCCKCNSCRCRCHANGTASNPHAGQRSVHRLMRETRWCCKCSLCRCSHHARDSDSHWEWMVNISLEEIRQGTRAENLTVFPCKDRRILLAYLALHPSFYADRNMTRKWMCDPEILRTVYECSVHPGEDPVVTNFFAQRYSTTMYGEFNPLHITKVMSHLLAIDGELIRFASSSLTKNQEMINIAVAQSPKAIDYCRNSENCIGPKRADPYE